jgi:hypothetical protein
MRRSIDASPLPSKKTAIVAGDAGRAFSRRPAETLQPEVSEATASQELSRRIQAQNRPRRGGAHEPLAR